MKRPMLLRLILAALMLPVAPSALAQGAGGAATSDAWQFEFMPYLWGASMKGDVGLGGPNEAELDQSFSDTLDVLDFGLMAAMEGRKGRWGFLFDGLYMKVSDGAATPGPLFDDANVKLIQQMYGLAGTYRAVEGATSLDLLAGARYNYMKTEIRLTGGLLPARRNSDSHDWVDGFVGLRAVHELNDRWSLMGYGDIGAGGSDLTWQLVAGASYRFSKTTSLKFGYRYLSVDYDRSDFLYDVDSQGLYLGLGIRF